MNLFAVLIFQYESDTLGIIFTPSGDVSCLATIPSDVKAEATFIAKEDGVVAGISLADMIFKQVDPSLKVYQLHSFILLFGRA